QVSQWIQFEKLVNKHRASLPVNLQGRFSAEKLAAIRRSMDYLGIAVDMEADVLRENARGQEPSVSQRTLRAWRFVMPKYRGKWGDMHRLAVAWRISDAKDVETFRTASMAGSRGDKEFSYPLPDAWRSVLEKP